jgi:two-component system cell cycle sensor histidine kinase/response regulator CckA
LAAVLFRFAPAAEQRTLSRAVVDSLPYGAVVAERDGRILYANAHYAEYAGKGSPPVGVARMFASLPEASEAVYRLSRAARDGRPAIEDVRLTRPLPGHETPASSAIWSRISVRALPKVPSYPKSLVIWSVENISRDRENQENIFLELQRAIDYLDHAPAGFFSADARGRIQYINSTLADWLGYDLAEFESGTLSMSEIVRGDGASLLMGGRAGGEIRTETIDIDLVRHNGTSMPVRLLHRAARLAEGELGETRTLVLDRTRGIDTEEELRAAEVRFSRFFNDTPFAIASLDAEGRIVRWNAPFTRIFGISAAERSLDSMPMAELIDENARAGFDNAVTQAMANVSDIDPVDSMLGSKAERAVRLYISSSEKREG